MLHTLLPAPGSRRNRKRVARGSSAGGGTTGGRGIKGQQSRTGKGHRFGFEGGQTPLLRRQPKLGGFRNPNRCTYEIITLEKLEERLDAGTYDTDALRRTHVARTKNPIKILARGTVEKKFNLTVAAASKGAIAAVAKAGGGIQLSNC